MISYQHHKPNQPRCKSLLMIQLLLDDHELRHRLYHKCEVEVWDLVATTLVANHCPSIVHVIEQLTNIPRDKVSDSSKLFF